MTLRAFLIGLAWVAVQSALAPYNNYVLRNSSFGGNLPLAPLLLLAFFVLIWNPAAARWTPKARLRSGELAFIWIMSAIASVLPLRGLTAFLIPLLASTAYFKTPENDWEALLNEAIPSWARVSDAEAARKFFESADGSAVPWEAWLKPLGFWTAFVLLCFLSLYCLCVLLRRPWVERERYSFPLARVPMELMHSPNAGRLLPRLLYDKRLWLGALIPILLHGLNALHDINPAVPEIPTRFHLTRGISGRPWGTLNHWPAPVAMIYPSVIGIGYLLPLEISFSLWFFFWAFKAQYVIISAFSIPIRPWTAASRQSIGAIIAVGCLIAWSAKDHLYRVVKGAFGFGSDKGEGELLSRRQAVGGYVGGAAGAALLLIWAGASVWPALAVMLIFLLISTVLTWMVANGGLMVVQAPFYPSDWIVLLFGSRAVGRRSLPILALPEHTLMRAWEQLPMPHFAHGARIGPEMGLKGRHIALALAGGVLAAAAVSYAATLYLGYTEGALNLANGGGWFTRTTFNRAANLIDSPVPPSGMEAGSVALGAAATAAMLLLRYQFVGFPLHPIGYAVGASSAPYVLWSSLFAAWAVKSLAIRLGGPKTYHAWRPLFFGLILGDYAAAGLLSALGFATGRGNNILPMQL